MENKTPVAEVKTTVYAAEMGDRTEGNQNWGETGGDLSSRTTTMQDVKDSAAEKAQEMKDTVSQYAQSAKDTAGQAYQSAKDTVSDYAQRAKDTANQYPGTGSTTTSSYSAMSGDAMYTPNSAYATSGYAQTSDLSQQDLKDKANQTADVAREKVGMYEANTYTGTGQQQPTSEVMREKMEQGREKLGQAYEAGAQKLHNAKDYTMETGHNVVDRLRETVGSTASALQHKSHEWSESAQHTLEQAREKAREVFSGAGQKVDEAANKMSATSASSTAYGSGTYQAGDTTEIKVRAEEAPTGGIDKLKIEAKSTNAQ
jgi:ElaB/YqjD/DUF883 family membrane-anchored ribosome-binding protein